MFKNFGCERFSTTEEYSFNDMLNLSRPSFFTCIFYERLNGAFPKKNSIINLFFNFNFYIINTQLILC